MNIKILREILDYDPETGTFRWKKKISKKNVVGAIAGHIDSVWGYNRIRIYGQSFRGNRLAFAHFYGRWPKGEIDHVNRRQADDRISNLREASRQEQMGNTSLYKNNTSGVKGVRRRKKRWNAYIAINGRHKSLGGFASKQEAQTARLKAAKKYFGAFACAF